MGLCVLCDPNFLQLSYNNMIITKLFGFALFLKYKCSNMQFQSTLKNEVFSFVCSLFCFDNTLGFCFLAQLLLYDIH